MMSRSWREELARKGTARVSVPALTIYLTTYFTPIRDDSGFLMSPSETLGFSTLAYVSALIINVLTIIALARRGAPAPAFVFVATSLTTICIVSLLVLPGFSFLSEVFAHPVEKPNSWYSFLAGVYCMTCMTFATFALMSSVWEGGWKRWNLLLLSLSLAISPSVSAHIMSFYDEVTGGVLAAVSVLVLFVGVLAFKRPDEESRTLDETPPEIGWQTVLPAGQLPSLSEPLLRPSKYSAELEGYSRKDAA